MTVGEFNMLAVAEQKQLFQNGNPYGDVTTMTDYGSATILPAITALMRGMLSSVASARTAVSAVVSVATLFYAGIACSEPKTVGDPDSVFPNAIGILPSVLPRTVRAFDSYWLEYELLISNQGAAPVVIHGVEATNGSGKRVASLSGDDIAERLSSEEEGQVKPGETAVLVMSVSAKDAEDLKSVTHQIRVSAGEGSAKAFNVMGGTVHVSQEARTDFAPPVRGGSWVVLGPFNPRLPGRRESVDVDGFRVFPHRFEMSLSKLADAVGTSAGSGAENADYAAFGEPVFAMADGRVLQVVNGVSDHGPGRPDATNPDGNFVLTEVGDEYLVYAGLQKGTIALKPGDRIKRGDLIGRIGNSGSSAEPELRVRLLTAPDPLRSTGLEFGFQSYSWVGWLKGAGQLRERFAGAQPGTRRGETPPSGSIVRF